MKDRRTGMLELIKYLRGIYGREDPETVWEIAEGIIVILESRVYPKYPKRRFYTAHLDDATTKPRHRASHAGCCIRADRFRGTPDQQLFTVEIIDPDNGTVQTYLERLFLTAEDEPIQFHTEPIILTL
jgi:hypothetical protein